ncbi:methyl-accepting chemotaxis protein [Lachnospira eligens]|uniref:methyl-accepting chemotaxis protein n=1 Tax=Lachnospira eligens TaxID=39485 RepID=UPI00189A669E|nr:methyl-accepting chemotaxis protein [Lachnospira eligens]
MKRYFCFFLAVLITAMSIIFYCPFNIYANDAFTISKNSTEKTGLSADEAQKAIDANADIKGKDGVTMLLYTPSDSYNYTLKSGAFVAHLSDSQAKAMLMSKKSFQQYVVLCSSLISNGTVFRGFLKTVGIATTGDSNALTNIVDKFTCNYNYLDSINYDEDTQTITMDNTSVDKLREEIKKYYYNSIGLIEQKSNGTVNSIIDSSDFRACFEYEEDYASVFGFKNYKYCLKTRSGFYYFFNDLPDYIYVSNDSNNDRFLPSYNNWDEVAWRFRTLKSDGSFGYFQPVKEDTVIRYDYTLKVNVSDMYFWYTPNKSDWVLHPDWNNRYSTRCVLYSKDEVSLKFWSSYSALYNYLHGDQNAYLSSTIEKTGEDITFSIKDMNENLGNKMDALIDSINSGKGNMSADELQNAIDKGIEDLNKNTEDIKDNTEEMNNKLDSILEALNTQNETLLEILGVTKKISDTVDDIDDTANFNTVISLCGTVFLAIQSAILYGQNTLKDDNNNTAPQSLASNNDDVILYASGGGTSLDYRGGIFGHFPFSVIYHLYDWLKVLQTQPKCPEFSYNYGYLIGKKDDENCIITFDLSQYEDWRKTISSFMKLSFTLAVAVGTYKKFKGGDVT